ncbi:aromatase/cyclase [Micromonospora sp. NPDC050980]|uniref:aromatase/cyclase n=1 Tax=Micromonospora sp. NPDC050980 TaxID=3155161 RepID=UPI0033F44E39
MTQHVTVEAPADEVFDLIVDVRRWPQFFGSLVHTSVAPGSGGATDEVRLWGVRGESAVRAWTARRWVDRENLRVTFDNDPPPPGATGQLGHWEVEPVGAEGCRVTLRHSVVAADAPQEALARVRAEFDRHSRIQLAELKSTAERRKELEELVIGWEDTLFVSGSAEDAWTILYEAGRWPERIPHVARIDLIEPSPGIQFFDMDTSTPDGRAHTTRSVRVCLPYELIVYKQITLPPMLEAHTGHWRFEQTPEGTVLGARHTVTLKRSKLSMLGPDTTVADARRYARRVLGTNSMKNLQIAKAHAEERADA